MTNIVHRVEVRGSAEAAYKSLSSLEGLASWWTRQTTGDCSAGGVIKFRFGERGGFDMKVIELDANKRVLWQVISGPDDQPNARRTGRAVARAKMPRSPRVPAS